jgi:hypothetical protein
LRSAPKISKSRLPLTTPELLALIEQLAPLGTVVVTNYTEGYQLLNYLRRYTAAPIRVILWISTFLQEMEERVYPSLPGALLERVGRLLFTDVTIYVAPMPKESLVAALGRLPEDLSRESPGRDLVTLDDFLPKSPMDHFFRYLRDAGSIVPLEQTRMPSFGLHELMNMVASASESLREASHFYVLARYAAVRLARNTARNSSDAESL